MRLFSCEQFPQLSIFSLHFKQLLRISFMPLHEILHPLVGQVGIGLLAGVVTQLCHLNRKAGVGFFQLLIQFKLSRAILASLNQKVLGDQNLLVDAVNLADTIFRGGSFHQIIPFIACDSRLCVGVPQPCDPIVAAMGVR